MRNMVDIYANAVVTVVCVTAGIILLSLFLSRYTEVTEQVLNGIFNL